MTGPARMLPDTDWHVRKLYEFSKSLGSSVIAAKNSRYVIDLNRSSTDVALYEGQFVTGLFPEQTFGGEDIYLPGQTISTDEKEERIEKYWLPYHEKISSALIDIKEKFGYALLWDAHSIPGRVPLLFDGELPALNFGTNDGASCAADIVEAVVAEAKAAARFSMVLDGRFKGGYITRRYGDPAGHIHAIQLELAQRSYMSEESCEFDDERASKLQSVLSSVLRVYLSSAATRHEGRD
jgi:N-formylglutamate amidohydrolase